MTNNYNSSFFNTAIGKTNLSKTKSKKDVTSKRSFYSFIVMFFFVFTSVLVNGQTTLISPTGDGSFEGANFAADGWTTVQGTTPANNIFAIGDASVIGFTPTNGTQGVFVTNNGTTRGYAHTSAITWIYKDITFPAGETVVSLKMDLFGNTGDAGYDGIVVGHSDVTYTASLTTGATGIINANSISEMSIAITGTSNGFIEDGNYATATNRTFSLINIGNQSSSVTRRVWIGFRCDGSVGTLATPYSFDSVQLTSRVPGNYVSITSGDWNNPTTWDANAIPSSGDNITVSAGHTVSINATGQISNNVTVDGILTYTTTPTSFQILGNLLVNSTGVVNVFNGTTGKTLNVRGNIINDGVINISVGTTSAGNLTLSGTTVQSISGTGTFTNNNIRNLTCSNTSTAIPNINWDFDNVGVEYNLNISNAKINLNNKKFVFGFSATSAGNTFTVTNGGFMNGTFSRWWTAGGTGYTTSGPTSIPTGAAGRYPFYTSSGEQRILYIGRTSPTVGGKYAVSYTDAITMTTGLNIVDGTYTITNRWDGNFKVNLDGTTPAATSYWLTLFTPNAFTTSAIGARVLGDNFAFSGTHINTSTSPFGQRNGVSVADLTTTNGIYLGINSSDIPVLSVTSGDWNNPSTWSNNAVPTCSDSMIISNGHTVTVNSAGNNSKSITVNSSGILTVDSGDLTVGCTLNNNPFINNGSLNVNGGILTVNGSMLHNAGSTFNQTGGNIVVDGNNAGDVATSVPSGTGIVQLNSQNINWTNGTLTIVDPHASATASNTFAYNNSTAHVNIPTTHTLKLGNGSSSDAGGNATNAFRLNTWVGSNRISFGNLIVDALAGTNRHVTTAWTFGINGNLEISAGSTLNFATFYVGGNIVNNGNLVSTSILGLSSFLNGTVGATSNAQTISGTGVYSNLAASPTANLTSLIVNNSNASGVTLDIPLSLSGTLTLTQGVVNTTDTNILTLGTATAVGTLSGGSSTAYINGPFARTFANNNANTNYLLFPIGKSTYAPISLAPATTAVSVMKAETFESNSGTASANIKSLANDRRWEAPIVSGTITNVNVRLGDANITSTDIPVQAPSATDVYTDSFGITATYAAGTPNTTQSNAAVVLDDYTGFLSYAESNVCNDDPEPGATTATSNILCYGQSTTLGITNVSTEVGLTYQWQSSPDGVTYSNISGANSTTYVASPSADTYYQCVVTCSTGSQSVASTPIQISLSSSVILTTPATRCGAGSVTLSATPNAGSSIAWFANETGGTALATGNNYTTNVSNTTTFYAAAQSATPGVPGSATLGAGGTTSTSVGGTFLPGAWGGAKTQYIIRASELLAAGIVAGPITSLGFEPTSAGQTYQGFNVNIGHTSLNTAPTATFEPNTGLTSVYVGTLANDGYLPVANTVNTLAFGTGTGTSNQFVWDGTSNIVVSISWSRVPAASTATVSGMKVDNVGFVSTSYRQRDSQTPAQLLAETSVSSTTSNRPRFTINGQVLCNSVRVPVVATVTTPPILSLSSSNLSICAGTPSSTITLTQGSTDYDTFVWSPSAGVSGDATNGWTFNPLSTTTYTLNASQSSGDLCANSTTLNVVVNPNPIAPTVLPATPSVCVNGILELSIDATTQEPSYVFGTGTTTNSTTGYPSPFTNYYGGTKHQMIIRASELTAMGLVANHPIVSLAFDVASVGSSFTGTLQNFQVDMGLTSSTVLTSAAFLPTTTNVRAAADLPVTAGIVTIPLTGNFIWDGTSNLVIQTSYSNGNSGVNNDNVQMRNSDPGFVSTNWFRADSSTASAILTAVTPSGSGNARPNMILKTSVPATFTWSPLTDLYTDAAAQTAYTGGATSTVYIKPTASGTSSYTVTATSAQNCTSSSIVSVTVNALPTVVTVAPATVCLPATVDLTAAAVTIGSDAGLTFTYWTDASATTALTSPDAVANSGTYYIKGENANGCSSIVPVAVTVGSLPTVVTVAPAAVCTPATVDLTAAAVTTGSDAGLTFTYWTDASATTALTSPDAVANSGTYYIKGENANGCSSIASVAVTVNALPTVVTVAPATVCSPATVDLTAAAVTTGSDAGLTFTYWTDASATTALTSPDAVANSGTYYIKGENANGCSSIASVVVTINDCSIGWANLQWPGTSTKYTCESETFYAQVWKSGVTEAAGQGAGITAWVGYNASNTDPSTWVESDWHLATFNVQVGNNDEYMYTVSGLPAGTYYVASRFQYTGGAFYYGGFNATGGGAWDGTNNINSVLTIQEVAQPTANAQSFCNAATVADLVATGSNLQWYSDATGGTALVSTTDLATGTYFVSQTINGCESIRTSVSVTVNSVSTPTGSSNQIISVDAPADATIEDLVVTGTNIVWYPTAADAAAGTNAIAAGTQLVDGSTYYAVSVNGTCVSSPFAVTVSVVLSRNDFDLSSLKYYPNPVFDQLNISYTQEIKSIEVYNINGQLVKVLKPNSNEVQVNMSELPAAMYIVKLATESNSTELKIMKK